MPVQDPDPGLAPAAQQLFSTVSARLRRGRLRGTRAPTGLMLADSARHDSERNGLRRQWLTTSKIPSRMTGMMGMMMPNPYTQYKGQLPMPGYMGTPTDAQGNPIQSFTDAQAQHDAWNAANPAPRARDDAELDAADRQCRPRIPN